MKFIDNKFETGEIGNLKFRFDPSPNVKPQTPGIARTLILHATEGKSVGGAVSTFKMKPVKGDGRSGLSIHLVLGKDGKEIVQMVSFDKGAVHAAEFNSKSIGIELDYPGDLRETGSDYKLRSNYAPESYIYASALNDSHFLYWPLYPNDQLNALLDITKALIAEYNITDVAGHEELASYKKDPGPAFPIVQFREQLGVKGRSIVLQVITRPVRVRNHFRRDAAVLSTPEIPAGTEVTIINEATDACLISVIGSIQGNPWIIGWVDKDAVRIKTDQEFVVNPDHYLATPEGRHFEKIDPHPNGFHQKKSIAQHKYIIVHFTTGTRVESTIAHFRNENSVVSAHVLIGRDGRVIQFLPFDKIAFHAGKSWWESDEDLNTMSIGIELDNAGSLKETPEGWFRKKIRIPDDRVKRAAYWRESKVRGWEIFPQTQLDVLERVVRALVDRYGGPDQIEMLGHDDVNLANRQDPGAVFPMPELREKIWGRKEARYKVHTLDKSAGMYANVEGNLPNPKTQPSEGGALPSGSVVKRIREAGNWSLVTVIRSKNQNLRKRSGWIRSNSLDLQAAKGGRKTNKFRGRGDKEEKAKMEVRGVTKFPQDFYPKSVNPPTPKLRLPKFQEDPRIRIQEAGLTWSLIVLLDFKGMEGWVESKFITPRPEPK